MICISRLEQFRREKRRYRTTTGTQVGGLGERRGLESQVLLEIGRLLPKRPHARIMHGPIGVPEANHKPHADLAFLNACGTISAIIASPALVLVCRVHHKRGKGTRTVQQVFGF